MTGMLHGMVIVLTVLIALATGLVLSRTSRTWIADDGQAAAFARGCAPGAVRPVVTGIAIAAAAGLLFPVGTAGPTGPAPTASPAAVGIVSGSSGPVDHIGLALVLGTVAGATPFLIRADVLLRRLPDRIVWPLIGVCFGVAALASVLGRWPGWSLALIAGTIAVLAFAGLHLLGRVLGARTMGLGDVKLAFVVFSTAALFHPWAAAPVLVAMMLVSCVWALIEAIRARRLRGVTIAFGPAMLSGMWLGSVLAPFVL
ncbi:prepilin peptidase [Brevibacterium renqingii]|uniref:prepilin peptidase n=1 Tax=Brevibacterium renqingii TaxID=2776916 RepID=UPI001AE0B0FE|nr:A24 family peptidase [Brevibacterium renqingii]